MKKALAMALCIVICASTLISGTIAFFTDEEKQDNVFEVGNVNIEQYEQERPDEGETGMQPFDQNQSLNPIVIPSDESQNKYEDYNTTSGVQLRDLDYFGNYLDKIVTVENIGKNAAYVRNIVAIPTGLPAGANDVKWLEFDFLDANGSDNTDWEALENPVEEDVEIDGVLYDLYVFNYIGTDGKLQPKDYTLPTLLGFGMSSNVNFEEKLEPVGDGTYKDADGNIASFAIEYETGKYGAYYYRDPDTKARTYLTITSLKDNHILVASQAVQVEGFESFGHAFKNGFDGDITEKNHPWYKGNNDTTGGTTPSTQKSIVLENGVETEYTWDQMIEKGYVTLSNDGTELKAISKTAGITQLVIPNGEISTISNDNSNNSNNSIKKVILPDGVKLSSRAFKNYDALTEIHIPGTTILDGDSHFDNCDNLQTVTFGNGIEIIPAYCFDDCKKLTNISFPESLTTINNRVFDSCISLTSIVFPSSLKSIKSYAFINCTGLTSLEFTQPSNLNSISSFAFDGCSNLLSVDVPASAVVSSSAFEPGTIVNKI